MLDRETRAVPMPAGGVCWLTHFTVFWRALEELTSPPLFLTEDDLVLHALELQRESGYGFEACFYDTVAYMHQSLTPPWYPRYLPRSSSRPWLSLPRPSSC